MHAAAARTARLPGRSARSTGGSPGRSIPGRSGNAPSPDSCGAACCASAADPRSPAPPSGRSGRRPSTRPARSWPATGISGTSGWRAGRQYTGAWLSSVATAPESTAPPGCRAYRRSSTTLRGQADFTS
ncbi:hypothetical protein G6F52_013988 [Rhizopus delemar]|nr:hypothetical protein G6F52_013988 [Rhizopus delemar]